jgi:Holliday junction resolvasome RuvABC endonuclease subunit
VIVIGIDPGHQGFALARLWDDPLVVGERNLDVYEAEANWQKLGLWSAAMHETHEALCDYLTVVADFAEGEQIYVFIEEPVLAGRRNVRTTLQQAQLVGALLAATTAFTRYVYLVPVGKWKAGTVGSGNASKPDVALWLNGVHPAYSAACGGKQDLIDACCIALYGDQVACLASTLALSGETGD